MQPERSASSDHTEASQKPASIKDQPDQTAAASTAGAGAAASTGSGSPSASVFGWGRNLGEFSGGMTHHIGMLFPPEPAGERRPPSPERERRRPESTREPRRLEAGLFLELLGVPKAADALEGLEGSNALGIRFVTFVSAASRAPICAKTRIGTNLGTARTCAKDQHKVICV